ncbi:MAG: thiamine ABC transporter substrate binding subunit [Rhodobacteraceae bacterium]|nr:MAG: thiamine ABC transporter substrate binding subunit [Paracoccaceae bacterium]
MAGRDEPLTESARGALPMLRLLSGLILAASAAAADDRPVLTVYTYEAFLSEGSPGPAVRPLFEAECDCVLRFVGVGDGADLVARLRLEGPGAEADVVLGLDTNLTAAAAATGLFAPHGLPLPEALAVPGGWDDPLFLPFDWSWLAFVYDETRLPEPPTSFADLLDAPDDVTIVVQDPRTSTPGLGLLMWVKHLYGDEAASVWERLAPRIVTVTRSWWEAYSAFLAGEAAMALSWSTSPAWHRHVQDDDTKRAALFDDGHYLQIEVAGVLASSRQPELARRFLAFMLSEPFQSLLPTTHWMYPAIALQDGLPPAYDGLIAPETSRLFPSEDVPAIREAALAEWLDVMSR